MRDAPHSASQKIRSGKQDNWKLKEQCGAEWEFSDTRTVPNHNRLYYYILNNFVIMRRMPVLVSCTHSEQLMRNRYTSPPRVLPFRFIFIQWGTGAVRLCSRLNEMYRMCGVRQAINNNNNFHVFAQWFCVECGGRTLLNFENIWINDEFRTDSCILHNFLANYSTRTFAHEWAISLFSFSLNPSSFFLLLLKS